MTPSSSFKGLCRVYNSMSRNFNGVDNTKIYSLRIVEIGDKISLVQPKTNKDLTENIKKI